MSLLCKNVIVDSGACVQVSCNFTQSLRAFSEECALILPLYTIARKRKARFCVHDGFACACICFSNLPIALLFHSSVKIS